MPGEAVANDNLGLDAAWARRGLGLALLGNGGQQWPKGEQREREKSLRESKGRGRGRNLREREREKWETEWESKGDS